MDMDIRMQDEIKSKCIEQFENRLTESHIQKCKAIEQLCVSSNSNEFRFVKTISSSGVQGITGEFELQSKENKLVFKISTEIDFAIEHEYAVGKSINCLLDFCPHFLFYYATKSMLVDDEYIKNPDNKLLYEKTQDKEGIVLPKTVLLMEKLEPLAFDKFCAKAEFAMITSQVIQILLGLQFAQKHQQFTHYDLHVGNILMQQCNYNDLFLYQIDGVNILVPTYGYYPVFIDFGLSYSQSLANKSMQTPTDNYHHGFQSTQFDKLNDVHHFLITLFCWCEPDGEIFKYFSNKCKRIFRRLPLLRASGWKYLPINFTKKIRYLIKNTSNVCEASKTYSNCHTRVLIALLNSLIKLPFKMLDEDELLQLPSLGCCMDRFFEQFDKLVDYQSRDDDLEEPEMLNLLKETVNHICNFKGPAAVYEMAMKAKYKTCVGVSWKTLFSSAHLLGKLMSHFYAENMKIHNDIIKRCYAKTKVQSPLDMALFFVRNALHSYKITQNTNVHIWNSDTKQKDVVNNLSSEQTNLLNKATHLKRADIIANISNISNMINKMDMS